MVAVMFITHAGVSGIDSSLADNFGRTIICALSAAITIVTVCFVGGFTFIAIILVLGVLYYNGELFLRNIQK